MFLECPDILQSKGLFPVEKEKVMKFYSHNWDTFLCRYIIYNIIFNGFSEVICEVIKSKNKSRANLKEFLRVNVKMAKKSG